MNNDEKLALLEAFNKRLKPALDDAKAEARQALLEDYETTHSDRRAILVGDEKVGEVGISYSTAAPFIFDDRRQEALEYLSAIGLTETVPIRGWEKHFFLSGGEIVCADTGEVVDWAGWNPKAPKSASIRGCKPDDVLQAFGNKLPDITALLEEGR